MHCNKLQATPASYLRPTEPRNLASHLQTLLRALTVTMRAQLHPHCLKPAFVESPSPIPSNPLKHMCICRKSARHQVRQSQNEQNGRRHRTASANEPGTYDDDSTCDVQLARQVVHPLARAWAFAHSDRAPNCRVSQNDTHFGSARTDATLTDPDQDDQDTCNKLRQTCRPSL